MRRATGTRYWPPEWQSGPVNIVGLVNIVLTGFMGTGKSTVGRVLAEKLGYTFVDTDTVIEQQHGPIPVIFAAEGEAAFRCFEAEVAATLAQGTHQVIATGGRLMLDPDNAAVLGATGAVFALTASADEILRRVLGDDHPTTLSTIDNMVDRSPQGRLEVAGGVFRYLHRCNWKMLVDNQTDTCHPMVAHESSAGTAVRVLAMSLARQLDGDAGLRGTDLSRARRQRRTAAPRSF